DAGVSSLSLWNRGADRAVALAADVAVAGVALRVLPPEGEDSLDRALRETTLLVNATSVGLDGTSLPIGAFLMDALGHRTGLRIFDMVYGPEGTPLVRQARARGLVAVDGLWMLVRQAAAAFALWTGIEPPAAVMHTAALASLASRDVNH